MIEIVVRPNRSLARPALAVVIAALCLTMFVVAGFSYFHGNVWAPLFALANAVVVTACLCLVWRRSGDFDRIVLDRNDLAIELHRGTHALRYRYPSAWVRLWRERTGSANATAGVYLGLHGRRTEVGRFLVDTERVRLERLLRRHLHEVRGALVPAGIESEARGQTA